MMFRNKMKDCVIEAYENAPKETRKNAVSVVSYSPKNKPNFKIRISLTEGLLPDNIPLERPLSLPTLLQGSG